MATPGNGEGGRIPPRTTGRREPNWTKRAEEYAKADDPIALFMKNMREQGVPEETLKALTKLFGTVKKGKPTLPNEDYWKFGVAFLTLLGMRFLGAKIIQRSWNGLVPEREITYKQARQVVSLVGWGAYFAARDAALAARSAHQFQDLADRITKKLERD